MQGYDSRDTDFGDKFGFRFGIEAEFILPFNKNKWGIIIEPTYQYYKSEKEKASVNVSGGHPLIMASYQSIEVPIGIRHYFYFNDKSKIFANISYVIDFDNNSSVEYKRPDGSIVNSLTIKGSRNIALGMGYKFKDKYSLEMRYQTNRDILSDYAYWHSEYKTFSILFGYSLF